MMTLPVTPLEAWIVAGSKAADAAALEAEQLRRLRRTVAYARSHSAFYRRHLAAIALEELRTPGDLAALPFTDADMLRADPLSWLRWPRRSSASLRWKAPAPKEAPNGSFSPGRTRN